MFRIGSVMTKLLDLAGLAGARDSVILGATSFGFCEAILAFFILFRRFDRGRVGRDDLTGFIQRRLDAHAVAGTPDRRDDNHLARADTAGDDQAFSVRRHDVDSPDTQRATRFGDEDIVVTAQSRAGQDVGVRHFAAFDLSREEETDGQRCAVGCRGTVRVRDLGDGVENAGLGIDGTVRAGDVTLPTRDADPPGWR